MNKAIKKIELDLGGKKITLTPKQAQNLKDALNELFQKEIIREVVKYIPCESSLPVPYEPYPVRPLYPYPWFWEWQRQPNYWYSTTDGTETGGTYCSNSSTLKLTA